MELWRPYYKKDNLIYAEENFILFIVLTKIKLLSTGMELVQIKINNKWEHQPWIYLFVNRTDLPFYRIFLWSVKDDKKDRINVFPFPTFWKMAKTAFLAQQSALVMRKVHS